MSYLTGMVTAVPTANRQAYIDHLAIAWPLLRKHGARRLVENWGVDVPEGKRTDFRRAVAATEDESIVFTWVEWADKAAADRAWMTMRDDPEMATMQMPFDASRMIFGGFEKIFDSVDVQGE